MMYSIGQVAQMVKINKETIRYYEKIGLLEDTKRDSNPNVNYLKVLLKE